MWLLCSCLLVLAAGPHHGLAFAQSRDYHHHCAPKRPRRDGAVYVSTQSQWAALEDSLSNVVNASISYPDQDSVLDPSRPPANDGPVLFRERHGWCPYSERAWLTLELANQPYSTVRIDNTGHGPKPAWWSSTTPQLAWPDTDDSSHRRRMISESLDIVYQLDQHYGLDLQSDRAAVQSCIVAFRDIFPRGARPSSRAAFLFGLSGDALPAATFRHTLQKTDEMLAQQSDNGPFMTGISLTAADVAWAPFLERYRYQLPALHEGLDPADAASFPHLAAWYKAMDQQVPAYYCRIAGNASSWRKVLCMAGYGNLGNVPPQVRENMARLQQQERADRTGESSMDSDLPIWQQYAHDRAHVAATPWQQAAMIIVRNREALARDTVKHATSSASPWQGKLSENAEQVEAGLLRLAHALMEFDHQPSIDDAVRLLAQFLDDRMCVPRDMGVPPATCIARLAYGF